MDDESGIVLQITCQKVYQAALTHYISSRVNYVIGFFELPVYGGPTNTPDYYQWEEWRNIYCDSISVTGGHTIDLAAAEVTLAAACSPMAFAETEGKACLMAATMLAYESVQYAHAQKACHQPYPGPGYWDNWRFWY